MRRRFLSATVITGIASVALAACFGTTIRPGEVGVTYLPLSGGLQKDVKTEGFYWQWPWNSIVRYSTQWQTRSEDVDVLTADALHVTTKVTVTYRPVRTEIYRLQNEIGPAYYEQIIQPSFLTLARSEFSLHEHNKLAADGPTIEAAVLAKLRASVAGKPIEIDRVAIKHIEFDPTVTQAISQKLVAAQKVEQKESELKIADRDAQIVRTAAQGQSDALRIVAEGQSAAEVIQAEGRAKALVLEGDGQAKAQAAITKTLTAAYLRYKAFDSDATRYYFVPVGKDGMPIIVNTEDGGAGTRPRGLANRTPQ